MADDDLSPEDQAAADTLIDELLDAGFTYEPNGRVAGFGGVEDPEEPEEPEEPETPSASADDPEEPETPADDGKGAHTGRLELRGTPLTEAEADGLLHVRKILIEHPELATEFNALVEARLQGAPAPAAPATPAGQAPIDGAPVDELPDWIDPADETSVGLWHRLKTLEAAQATDRETVTNATDAATRAKIQSDIASAVDRFKAAHPDLDEDDIRAIRDHTSASVNVQGVMANFPGDPVEGLVRALEIGSMTDPVTRDKVLGVKDTRPAKDAQRQRALSALAGGGGTSRSRVPKERKPAGWTDVANKLAAEIANLER